MRPGAMVVVCSQAVARVGDACPRMLALADVDSNLGLPDFDLGAIGRAGHALTPDWIEIDRAPAAECLGESAVCDVAQEGVESGTSLSGSWPDASVARKATP